MKSLYREDGTLDYGLQYVRRKHSRSQASKIRKRYSAVSGHTRYPSAELTPETMKGFLAAPENYFEETELSLQRQLILRHWLLDTGLICGGEPTVLARLLAPQELEKAFPRSPCSRKLLLHGIVLFENYHHGPVGRFALEQLTDELRSRSELQRSAIHYCPQLLDRLRQRYTLTGLAFLRGWGACSKYVYVEEEMRYKLSQVKRLVKSDYYKRVPLLTKSELASGELDMAFALLMDYALARTFELIKWELKIKSVQKRTLLSVQDFERHPGNLMTIFGCGTDVLLHGLQLVTTLGAHSLIQHKEHIYIERPDKPAVASEPKPKLEPEPETDSSSVLPAGMLYEQASVQQLGIQLVKLKARNGL